MKQMSIRVDSKTRRALKQQVKQAGRPLSAYVRDLINYRGPGFAASLERAIRK
jgi:predicted DNA-binding protein